MTEFVQIHTTTDNREIAEKIARRLVENRLAACVQVFGPVTSVYHWQGEVETSEEWLCLAKSRADLFSHAEAAIRDVHNYDTPEILASPVAAGSAPYLDWMNLSLREGE